MGKGTTENNVSLSISEQAMRCLVVVMYNSSEAIIIHDMDGNITIWNRGAEKMYGYRVEEALGMNIDLITPAGKLAEQKEYFRRLLAGEVVDSFETRRLAKDGSILDVWLTVTKVLEEPTDSVISQEREIIKPIGLELLERNITMRKRAEAELREKEGLLANIYENVNELLFYVDVEADGKYRFRSVNPAFLKTTGLEADQVVGKDVSEVISEPSLSIFLSNYHKAIQNRERVSWEETTLYPSENRTGEVTIVPIINEQGVCKGLIGTVYDITERKITEEQLKSASLYNRSLIETSLDPLVTISFDGRITDVNNATEMITGYSRDELIGTDFSDYFTDPKQAREGYQGVFKEGLMRDFFLEIKHRDGCVTPVLYNASVYRDEIDNIVGIVAAARDITQRKEADRRTQEANVKLSCSVKELEERTEEISQLSEMGENLQSCQSIEEAGAISALHIRKLFPGSQGALYLINPAKDSAEVIEMWGDSASMANMFMPLKCWAIRRCRTYLVDDFHPGPLCGHINGSPDGQYLCVPMMAHGEVLGIFHLNHPAPESDQQKTDNRVYNEHKCQLAQAISEHIALALSNLRLQETLRQHSIRDILTSLFNRRYMEESLTRELRRAEREKRSVGVMMFDIDHFRDFNDRFGHAGGDSLLRQLGAFLNARIRGGDIVSRYGGEEFVSVLPGATLEETSIRAEELRQGVKELRIYHQGKPLGQTTISIGVAAFPKNGLTGDEILKSADNALYRAKNEGRDRVIVASTIN